MSTIPGLFVLGEANFSDHGANRLGASALMQGLADGYFVAPYTVGNYLASEKLEKVTTDNKEFTEAKENLKLNVEKLFSIKGKKQLLKFIANLEKLCGIKLGWDEIKRIIGSNHRDFKIARRVLAKCLSPR